MLDRNAALYDKKGNLLPQYQKALDAQIAKAQSDYGEFNIHLDVSFTRGQVSKTGNALSISKGAVQGALNVAVIDADQIGDVLTTGVSSLRGGIASTYLNLPNVRGDTLSHELAHQFGGDTGFRIPNIGVPGLNVLVGGVVATGANVYTDIRKDWTLSFPVGFPGAPRPASYPGRPANWGMFNRGARKFALP